MSFEGYYQKLCKNGHLNSHDVYVDGPEDCMYCRADFILEKIVDNTNGEDERLELEMLSPAKVRCCDCGSESIEHLPAVYKLPKE